MKYKSENKLFSIQLKDSAKHEESFHIQIATLIRSNRKLHQTTNPSNWNSVSLIVRFPSSAAIDSRNEHKKTPPGEIPENKEHQEEGLHSKRFV